MKKVWILLMMLVASSVGYSQDYLKKLEKCDNQQKKNRQKIEKLNNDTANLHQSIAKYEIEIKKHKDTILDYDRKIKELRSRASELNKDKAAKAKEKRSKTDSVNMLLKTNETLVNQVAKLKRTSIELDKQIRDERDAYDKDLKDANTQKHNAKQLGFDKGKTEVGNSIAGKYNGKTLDDLISMDSYDYIKGDVAIVDSVDKSGDVKMLTKYYEIKNCLNVKYDEQTVAKSTESIDVIIRKYAQKGVNSIKARELKALLVDYKDINEAFVALVDSLDTYNQKEIIGDQDKIAKKKKSYYMKKISDFVGFYDNFDQYPYIYDRLFEIISIKSSDDGINKNVGYLLN